MVLLFFLLKIFGKLRNRLFYGKIGFSNVGEVKFFC